MKFHRGIKSTGSLCGVLAALLCAVSLFGAQTDAQQSDAARKQIPELILMAEQGSAASQNDLGKCYYSGKGVAKDYVEAVK